LKPVSGQRQIPRPGLLTWDAGSEAVRKHCTKGSFVDLAGGGSHPKRARDVAHAHELYGDTRCARIGPAPVRLARKFRCDGVPPGSNNLSDVSRQKVFFRVGSHTDARRASTPPRLHESRRWRRRGVVPRRDDRRDQRCDRAVAFERRFERRRRRGGRARRGEKRGFRGRTTTIDARSLDRFGRAGRRARGPRSRRPRRG